MNSIIFTAILLAVSGCTTMSELRNRGDFQRYCERARRAEKPYCFQSAKKTGAVDCFDNYIRGRYEKEFQLKDFETCVRVPEIAKKEAEAERKKICAEESKVHGGYWDCMRYQEDKEARGHAMEREAIADQQRLQDIERQEEEAAAFMLMNTYKPYQPAPTVNCTTNTVGSMTFTNCH